MIVTVMFNTLADGITPYAAESFNDANGATEGSLDEMMVKFVGNIFEPSRALFSWFAFVAGSVFIVIGISRLLKTSQDGPRGPGGIGTIMTFLTGGALVSFNPMIGAFSSSLFGTANVKTFATLAYADGMTNAEIAHVEAVYGAVIQFMIILGLVSFLRGIFIFRGVAEGNSQASMMAGVTHLVGGALAVNLGPFLNAVQETLGLSGFGIGFSYG